MTDSRLALLRQQLAGLEQAGRFHDLLQVLEELIALEPANTNWLLRKGAAQFDLGMVDAAAGTLDLCHANGCQDPRLHLYRGHVFAATGSTTNAAASYHQLLSQQDPALICAAYWSLADMRGYRFSPAEIKDLKLRVAVPDMYAGHLHFLLFTLGIALEQNNEIADAFDMMQQANDFIAPQRPFHKTAYQQLANSLRQIKSLPGRDQPDQSIQPIFIVGMPRSGTSLVEQILASHSQVEGAGELPYIDQMARSLDHQGGFANVLAQISNEQCETAAKAYLQQAQSHLQQTSAYIVDKWPDNFWYLGLIQRLFPDAPIINVIRDPVDNAIGVFKQYFTVGNGHSFQLAAIADYWEIYLAVMQHWQQLMPAQIYHLSYERLVRAPEQEITALLNFCQLPAEAACYRPHETQRNVMTPSSSQLRAPLSDQSIGSGSRYLSYMGYEADRLINCRDQIKLLLNQ